MLTQQEIEQVTGVHRVKFGEKSSERRRNGRLGIIGRAILCRCADGAPYSAVGVRIRDISRTGIHLLCEDHSIPAHEEFILGLERKSSKNHRDQSLIWVKAQSLRANFGGGRRTAIAAIFVARTSAPSFSHLTKPRGDSHSHRAA